MELNKYEHYILPIQHRDQSANFQQYLSLSESKIIEQELKAQLSVEDPDWLNTYLYFGRKVACLPSQNHKLDYVTYLILKNASYIVEHKTYHPPRLCASIFDAAERKDLYYLFLLTLHPQYHKLLNHKYTHNFINANSVRYAIKGGDVRCVKLLMFNGANYYEHLYAASAHQTNSLALTELLLVKDGKTYEKNITYTDGHFGYISQELPPAIHSAVFNNRIDLIQLFAKYCQVDWSHIRTTVNAVPLLHTAVSRGNESAFTALLELGADPHAVVGGVSAIHAALKDGRQDFLEYLITRPGFKLSNYCYDPSLQKEWPSSSFFYCLEQCDCPTKDLFLSHPESSLFIWNPEEQSKQTRAYDDTKKQLKNKNLEMAKRFFADPLKERREILIRLLNRDQAVSIFCLCGGLKEDSTLWQVKAAEGLDETETNAARFMRIMQKINVNELQMLILNCREGIIRPLSDRKILYHSVHLLRLLQVEEYIRERSHS